MTAASGVGSLCVKGLSLVLASLFILSAYPVSAGWASPSEPALAPSPQATMNATEVISGLLGTVGGDMLAKHIQKLQDFGTRYSPRGDKCYAASEYIYSVFEQNGLNASYDYFPYSIYNLRNVIGVKEGKTMPGATIIICAHYDSHTAYAWSDAPGADDNGSGTAAVLAIAETLSDYDFNCTIKFIAFSGEEQGLLGSEHYAAEAVESGENIIAVLNMDMIAHNPEPATPYVLLEIGDTGGADPSGLIAEVYETVTIHPEIGLQVLDGGPTGQTDHYYFSFNYPAVAFFEYQFSLYYHQVTDTIDKLNMTYCANVTQIVLATAARIAGIQPGDIAPPALSPGFPGHGTYSPGLPRISIEATDPGQLNLSAMQLTVNGAPVATSLQPISQGYNISYTPAVPLADGLVVNVSLSVPDASGNLATRSWTFTIDSVAPLPPTDFTISNTMTELIKQGTALDVGTTYDSMHVLAPSVIYKDGEYKMWYTASSATAFVICYANSTAGVTWDSWTKQGVVIYRGAAGQPDSYNAGYPTVIYDGEYKMWYSGFDNSHWRILYANSTDGLNWVKRGVALDVGPAGSMDSKWAMHPCVLKNGEYKMWYVGFDGVEYRCLYANSTDGLAWSKSATDATPGGSGKRYGDGIISDAEVAYDGERYWMYYGTDDGLNIRTLQATSLDGLVWDDIGLAIDIGSGGDYDGQIANHCAVIFNGSETRVYYSGFNGNWRILLANKTPADISMDLMLSWEPSASPDVVCYELFRETRPVLLAGSLERDGRVTYLPPDGVTPWAFEPASAANVTVYGPAVGPGFFYLPEDCLLDLTLCIESGTGEWSTLLQDSDYTVDTASGFVQLLMGGFQAGSEIHAWYNCSAARGLRTGGSGMADVRAGAASLASYYYVIRAVDRAGNVAQCPYMVGKIGTDVVGPWGLVGNPFLEGPTPVSEALEGMEWTVARTWDPAQFPHEWTIARRVPTELPDTLLNLTQCVGIWTLVSIPSLYVEHGRVSDVTIGLVAGWNLVSYPYHEIRSVSDALAGVPWDHVEVFSQDEPGMLLEVGGDYLLRPGIGLWVHTNSDADWTADNVP